MSINENQFKKEIKMLPKKFILRHFTYNVVCVPREHVNKPTMRKATSHFFHPFQSYFATISFVQLLLLQEIMIETVSSLYTKLFTSSLLFINKVI